LKTELNNEYDINLSLYAVVHMHCNWLPLPDTPRPRRGDFKVTFLQSHSSQVRNVTLPPLQTRK